MAIFTSTISLGKLLYNISKKQKLRLNFLSVSNLLNYSELDANTGQRTRSDLNQNEPFI